MHNSVRTVYTGVIEFTNDQLWPRKHNKTEAAGKYVKGTDLEVKDDGPDET